MQDFMDSNLSFFQQFESEIPVIKLQIVYKFGFIAARKMLYTYICF